MCFSFPISFLNPSFSKKQTAHLNLFSNLCPLFSFLNFHPSTKKMKKWTFRPPLCLNIRPLSPRVLFPFLHTDILTLTPALGTGGRHALTQKTDFTQNPAAVTVIALLELRGRRVSSLTDESECRDYWQIFCCLILFWLTGNWSSQLGEIVKMRYLRKCHDYKPNMFSLAATSDLIS